MNKLDVVREIKELKTQLAYSKNLGFFFGAGTSCALGVPNIAMLTASVEGQLAGDALKSFLTVRDDLKASGSAATIEDILNQVRRIREITGDSKAKQYLTVSGENAKNLDGEVCRLIYKIITEAEEKADLTIPTRLFAWLNLLNRDRPKEIFTSNYDLIVERSLEASQIPYFDGFVGSYEPFFLQESIDCQVGRSDITRNWIRLWKVHGSLNWFWKAGGSKAAQKILRVGKFDKGILPDQELVIYPSKEKYDSSRKQPFVAYFDRLQACLLGGELFFVCTGYSFSDQHINEIIFSSLRQNQRLFCAVFCYTDAEVERLASSASVYLNLTVFGPTKAIVNGSIAEWQFIKPDAKEGERFELYFDEASGKLKLGDFCELVTFLISCSGRADMAPAKP